MNDQKSIAGPVNSAMASANEVGTLSEHFREGTDFESMEILPIQFNLSVGAVDDPLEREANTVADHVMRMPEKPFIQRCA
ncbi:MAG: hypothetical protein IPP71_10325 [Bacteroidetes bacterium]|nr:hypothetical protein [Bacteroidota bacterium]